MELCEASGYVPIVLYFPADKSHLESSVGFWWGGDCKKKQSHKNVAKMTEKVTKTCFEKCVFALGDTWIQKSEEGGIKAKKKG